jgi:hypothetical protein
VHLNGEACCVPVSAHMPEQPDFQGALDPGRARVGLRTPPDGRDSARKAGPTGRASTRIWRGIVADLRARSGVFLAVAVGVLALELLLPPAVLSAARRPADYFTFNPWLPELPRFLSASDIPWQRKLEFFPNLALFWFSADSPFGGTDWGFAVTVGDLFRFTLMALLFGAYFALLIQCRDRTPAARWNSRPARRGGALGVLASVFGFSTGGCTVIGCGAPVIPVVGLAFVGLSSGTLVLLAELSRVATGVVFVVVTFGIIYLGWIAGGRSADD